MVGEESKLRGVARGPTVTAMIVCIDRVAFAVQRGSKRAVSTAVLRHAVRDLNDRSYRTGRQPPMDEQLHSVSRRQREGGRQRYTRFHHFLVGGLSLTALDVC